MVYKGINFKLIFSIFFVFQSVFSFCLESQENIYINSVKEYFMKKTKGCQPYEEGIAVPEKIVKRFMRMSEKNIKIIKVDGKNQMFFVLQDALGELTIRIHLENNRCDSFELYELSQ